jgi:peptide/nickel transport system substrate-binding protein
MPLLHHEPKRPLIRPTRRGVIGGGAAGLAAGFGAGLPWPATAQAPTRGGTLRVGLQEGSTSDSLDPQTYTGFMSLALGFATHNTLTEIAPGGELVGDLAEEWEANADASVWTFRLRPGVEFHDGKPLEVEDVIASLDLHRGEDSKSAAKPNVAPIQAMRKRDERTLVFELDAPNADFPFLMADYHLLVFPAVDGESRWRDYVGTGGYVLERFDPGVSARLTRHPNYWKDGRAWFDAVEITVLPDANARQAALLTGDVDVISRLDLKTVGLLSRRPGLRVEEATGFIHYTAPMITTASPFESNELRLAIKHGIDRQELLDKILFGHGVLASDQPIGPNVPFHADLPQRERDPDKARFHLKKAGLENVTLDLSAADTAYAGAVDAAVLMKEQLRPVGIDVNVVREPNDGYWSNVWMKKPWCQAYWGGRPTCDWMFSTAYKADANWNDTFWDHERFNRLLLEGRSELDPAKRAEIYGEMQRIVSEEGGQIVWSFANYVYAMADRVRHEEEVAANWMMDGGRFIERWWLA